MEKIKFEVLKKEAFEEGQNDTHVANELIASAQLYIEEQENLTDKQRDVLMEEYHQGFKSGI